MFQKDNLKFTIPVLIAAAILIFGILFFLRGKTVNLKNEDPKNSISLEAENNVQNNEQANEPAEESAAKTELTESQPNKSNSATAQTDKTPEPESQEKSADPSSDFSIKKNLVGWGFKASTGRKIDTLVIHNSYDISGNPYDFQGILNEWKDYGVAPHYLIDRSGEIYQLVDEKNIAYHAGVSQVPDGRTDVNNFSIGIELMNTQEDKLSGSQYSALNNLIKDIKKRHSIKYILGHSQIAPGRKTDPWNMDWSKINK
jgi:hypothetical protein